MNQRSDDIGTIGPPRKDPGIIPYLVNRTDQVEAICGIVGADQPTLRRRRPRWARSYSCSKATKGRRIEHFVKRLLGI